MVPNCRAWDPTFAGEVAVIVDHAMRGMLEGYGLTGDVTPPWNR